MPEWPHQSLVDEPLQLRQQFGHACVTATAWDELLPKNSAQEKGPEIIRAFFC